MYNSPVSSVSHTGGTICLMNPRGPTCGLRNSIYAMSQWVALFLLLGENLVAHLIMTYNSGVSWGRSVFEENYPINLFRSCP